MPTSKETGAPKLLTPYNTSEMRAMCELGRSTFNRRHDELVVIAAELKPLLANLPSNNPWLLGADSKMAAWKIVRNITHAAGLSQEAAKAMVRSWAQYQQYFLEGSSHKKFDPNK